MIIDTEQQLIDALRAEGFDVREGRIGGAYVRDTGDTVTLDMDRSLWFFEDSGSWGVPVTLAELVKRLRGGEEPPQPPRPPSCLIGKFAPTEETPDATQDRQDRSEDLGTRTA